MRGQPFVFDSIGGGVNLQAAPYSVDATQARDVLNVHSTFTGSVRKRNGFETFASPTKVMTSLWAFNRASNFFLVGVGDQSAAQDMYKITTGGTVSSIKGAATMTTATLWEGIQAPASGGQGPLWMMNGVDTPLQWTSSGNVASWTAATGSLPNGQYMTYADLFLFVAGVTTNPTTKSTLYRSNLVDPRDWASPGGATTLLDPDDGQDISGIGKVGPYVLAFKPRKTFVVTDTTALATRRLSDQVGCSSHRSIAETDIGTFFLSKDQGVMITDGVSVNQIGVPIKPLTDQIPATMLPYANAVYKDYRYYLSFSIGGGSNDTIAEFDTKTSTWWIHRIYLDNVGTYTGVNQWAILQPMTTADFYAAGASSATQRVFTAFKSNVWQDRSDTDSGTYYPSYVTFGWNSFGQPHLRKVIRQIRADAIGEYACYVAKSFSINFTQQDTVIWELADTGTTTFGGGDTFGGGGTYGDSPTPTERRFYTPGTTRSLSIKFQNADVQPWELYAYTIAVDTRRD